MEGVEDSISNITKGLFDDIKTLRTHKSDMYDYEEKKDDVLDSLELNKSKDNNISFDKYDYYKQLKKEKENKYNKLSTPSNPLNNYVDEYFDDKDIIDKLSKSDVKHIEKQIYKESSMEYVMLFRKLVDKIEKLLYKWVPKFNCYNYIIKDGNKFRCARSLKELDKNSYTNDNNKIKFLRKLINESAFTDQIITKYIRKYNTNPQFITDKDIPKIQKFYEDNIIKAFKNIINKYKF